MGYETQNQIFVDQTARGWVDLLAALARAGVNLIIIYSVAAVVLLTVLALTVDAVVKIRQDSEVNLPHYQSAALIVVALFVFMSVFVGITTLAIWLLGLTLKAPPETAVYIFGISQVLAIALAYMQYRRLRPRARRYDAMNVEAH